MRITPGPLTGAPEWVATPGQPDLTMDARAMRVTGVTEPGRGVTRITFAGGFGKYRATPDDQFQDTDHIEYPVEFSTLPGDNTQWAPDTALLDRWQKDEEPLRVVSTGAAFTAISHDVALAFRNVPGGAYAWSTGAPDATAITRPDAINLNPGVHGLTVNATNGGNPPPWALAPNSEGLIVAAINLTVATVQASPTRVYAYLIGGVGNYRANSDAPFTAGRELECPIDIAYAAETSGWVEKFTRILNRWHRKQTPLRAVGDNVALTIYGPDATVAIRADEPNDYVNIWWGPAIRGPKAG